MASERPNLLRRWGQAHARTFFFSLGKLTAQPVGSLLTAAVIGITLSLPAGLEVLVRNVSAVSTAWEGSVQASLYLKDNVDDAAGRALAGRLVDDPQVASAHFHSRAENLAEFRELSGFDEALDLLDDNPLPSLIRVQPTDRLPPEAVAALADRLAALPEVDIAKLDQQWLARLHAILQLVSRAVWIIAAGLALAVIITVGNTIRLDIERRREEIVVMKLIGAPDPFIRRPFLYTGAWYGLGGGLFALLLVQGTVLAVAGPASVLSGLYESHFELQGLTLDGALALLLSGLALGWLGAFWTVHRHLREIDPGAPGAGT